MPCAIERNYSWRLRPASPDPHSLARFLWRREGHQAPRDEGERAITESLQQPVHPPARSPEELLYLRCVGVAFSIAKDVTTADALLAGQPVDQDRLDPDGLAWARARLLVRLDVRAIDLFDYALDRIVWPTERLRSMPLEEFRALFREAA